MRKHHRNESKRNSLCIAAIATTIASMAGPAAVAQVTSEENQLLDVVTVTGSRIRSDNVVSKQPMNTIAETDFDKSGVLTVAEALNELPQMGASFGSQSQDITTLNQGFNAGAELLNLRNLGPQRTLVLVNGRRHVGADPGTSSVDLNSIPSEMIDRIEVVTGANSAVYGADAVSGVVNVILKESYEGTAITGRLGTTNESDAEEYAVSLTHGGSLSGGKANYLASVEYSKNEGVFGVDRDWAQQDGAPGSFSLSNGLPLPVYATDAGLFTYDASGQTAAWPAGAAVIDQRMPYRTIQLPTERFLASGKFDYEVNASHDFFVEGTYSRTESDVQYEPQFFWFRNLNASQFDAPPIPDDNPFLVAFLTGVGATSLNDNSFNIRRFTEYGARVSKVERDLTRIATGFSGVLGDFDYEVYYQYGRSDVDQTDAPSVDRNRFFAGLFVDDNGTPGDFSDDACADPAFVSLGCTPFNPFGIASIEPLSDEFIAYSLIPGVTSNVVGEQHVLSGYVTGDAFQLPAGSVAFVLGGEFRDDKTTADVHPSLQDGSNAIRQISVVEGGVDVLEIFGEIEIPIIADRFNIGSAIRYSDYNTVGGEFTWGVNADFVVSADIRLRASVGQATRAPNVNELFSSVINSTVTLADPCANDFNADGVADAGVSVPQGCADQLGTSYVLSEDPVIGSVVRNQTGGNLSLDSETADTLTIGAVFSPTFIDGFVASIDYFSIEIEDVIGSLSTTTVIDQCYNTPGLPATFCNLVSRDPSGLLSNVNTQLFNIAEEKVEGIDFQAVYSFDAWRGSMTALANYSHLIERSRTEFSGAPLNDFTGRIDAIENSGRLGLGYVDSRFSMDWTGRFMGSALAGTSEANLADSGNDIDSFFYHDLQASIFFGDDFTATVGVKNVTDEAPPLVTEFSNSGLVPSAGVTAGGVYDTRGRFMYITATKRF